MKEQKGLIAKFIVTRQSTGEQVFDPLFVLLPEKDVAARQALVKYSECTQNKVLSDDIKDWVAEMQWNPIMEDEKLKDRCLLCENWVARKPQTKGEKLFWHCKKEIIESVAYDDRPGIIQMASPFRCVHYARIND